MHSMATERIDNKLKALREKLGLSQEGVARKLNVTLQSVFRWDNDKIAMPEEMRELLILRAAGKYPGWCAAAKKEEVSPEFMQEHIAGCGVCRVANAYVQSGLK
jgi:transcriptional regulator with XRE-family HTH domain